MIIKVLFGTDNSAEDSDEDDNIEHPVRPRFLYTTPLPTLHNLKGHVF